MTPKSASALDAVPLRNVKATLETGEAARRNPTPASGAMVEAAMRRAKLEVKQLAAAMGVSESFLLRGFKDQEHISWQRLQRVPDVRFKRALLAVQAEEDSGIVTTLHIHIPQEKVG